MMTIQDLLDLSKTIAAPLFAGKTYPWEALAEIGDFILQLGPTLPAEEYEQRGEDIWIARDAKIFDSAYIAGPCIIDHGAELRQCAFVRGNAIVGKNAVVGNSCELKNVVLFDNVQTPHFNYVGDSILGYKSHMGAGSITCNYDGVHKHKTVIGKDAFIGSDTMMVAPAQIGDGALVAAGSVITEPVPADALGLGRARQVNIEGWAADYRRRLHEDDEV